MADLLYVVEGEQVLHEIKQALADGTPSWIVARDQDCDPLDIKAIAAALRRGNRDGALGTARAIYGLRSERRQALTR